MITQEINLHQEPKPTYTPPTTTQNVVPFHSKSSGVWYSQYELNQVQTKAINAGIRTHSRWKIKNSPVMVVVIGWNLVAGFVETIDGIPAIIKGRRESPLDNNRELIFNYTIDEILEMEQVYE